MMRPMMAATCALVAMLLGVSRYVHTTPFLLSILPPCPAHAWLALTVPRTHHT